ncbi:MAG: SpoIIE family protein phosphatase [Hydrogenoanaerobacterium sp.]
MEKMRTYKLGHKITALCILLAMLICAGSSISGYFHYRNSAYKTYNDFGYEMAQIARSYIDGDNITKYLETGKPDLAYEQMATQLRTLYENSNLNSIYICVPNPKNMTLTNIYDVRINDVENPKNFAIGAVDPIGSNPPENVANVFLTGQRSHDYFIRKTEFGFNSSAILPVLNSAGNPVALVVTDVPMPYIQKNLNKFLLYTVAITALIVLAFIAFFQVILQRSVVRPILLIASEAKNFTENHGQLSENLREIKSMNEIGTLAEVIYKMQSDIRSYIINLTAVTAEKERIGAELDVAKHIQASMLPSIFPAFPERPELDIYATMTPAREVGGDFYDFFLIDDDHLGMVMADVSGKGVPAALFMVIAKTLIKNVSQTGLSPKAVLEKVNKQLCVGNEVDMFVTVWLGILEISTGKMLCANAGHEYPVIKRANEDYELLKDKHGFVLAGLEHSRYTEYELQMHQGDRIFLYTDGVPEATNTDNELYGTDRMIYTLNLHKECACEELLAAIQQDVNDFAGQAPQFDDITMLCLTLMPADTFGMQKLKLPPSLEAMEKVTAFVEQRMEEAGVPMKIVAQMNIAVDEIFSNIARYSGATDATVGVKVSNGSLTLRFADNGLPYDPTETALPDTTLSAEERGIGGLGLLMVRKFMDTLEYHYHDGLNILTLKKQMN